MRLADEPAERAPSGQITRQARDDARGSLNVERGDFDQAFEQLEDAGGAPETAE
jgi:hypothetical protein